MTKIHMTNHLGHVYGVFDKTGNRVESHSYSAYGYASGDDFSLQPFGMSTKRSDFASGLVYFGYRFYMPNLGRGLNRDPLQEQGGINLYAYVQGDPLGDPDGWFAAVLIYAVPTVIAIAAFYDGLERCKALGRCDFSGLWHSNEAAESEGDSSDVPVNCPTEAENKTGSTGKNINIPEFDFNDLEKPPRGGMEKNGVGKGNLLKGEKMEDIKTRMVLKAFTQILNMTLRLGLIGILMIERAKDLEFLKMGEWSQNSEVKRI